MFEKKLEKLDLFVSNIGYICILAYVLQITKTTIDFGKFIIAPSISARKKNIPKLTEVR